MYNTPDASFCTLIIRKAFVRKSRTAITVFNLLLLLMNEQTAAQTPAVRQNPPVVIGYVAGYSGLIDTSKIEATKLTHINYAFVDVKDSCAWLHNEKTDTVNLGLLNSLKAKNPALKILISIGGWSWSKNFSDAVLTEASRLAFAASAVQLVQVHQLDGIDIDWEYPNQQGDGNTYRPEDKHNYTLMFQALRQQLNLLQQQTGKQYLLTAAVGGFSSFLQNTEMQQVQTYLNYINLMTYDYGWGKATHHTNLYTSDNDESNSADKTFQAFVKAGVPANKLVMGLAFYGRGKIVESTVNNGLHQPSLTTVYAGGFTFLKDSLMQRDGYKRYWDEKAKAPYLFNAETKTFISYDDEESVKYKCQYVKQNKMAGVMFWEYSDDWKGYLLAEINKQLRR